MTEAEYENPVPPPGKVSKYTVSELFGLTGRGRSQQLTDDLESIRIAELEADRAIASIKTN